MTCMCLGMVIWRRRWRRRQRRLQVSVRSLSIEHFSMFALCCVWDVGRLWSVRRIAQRSIWLCCDCYFCANSILWTNIFLLSISAFGWYPQVDFHFRWSICICSTIGICTLCAHCAPICCVRYHFNDCCCCICYWKMEMCHECSYSHFSNDKIHWTLSYFRFRFPSTFYGSSLI